MLNTRNNWVLLCALLMHTATHTFRIPFFSDFYDVTQNLMVDAIDSDILIEKVKNTENESHDTLVVRITNIDLPSNEDSATPTATLERASQDKHQNIEIPIMGGLVNIVIEDQQFVRATVTQRIEQYRDDEGAVSSSVQHKKILRSYQVNRPLIEDSYSINYNKTDRELIINFHIDTESSPQKASERIPLDITVQD